MHIYGLNQEEEAVAAEASSIAHDVAARWAAEVDSQNSRYGYSSLQCTSLPIPLSSIRTTTLIVFWTEPASPTDLML